MLLQRDPLFVFVCGRFDVVPRVRLERSCTMSLESDVRFFAAGFVNRLAYVVQSEIPDENGRYPYRRPDRDGKPVPITATVIAAHLNGEQTIGLYALNPRTQRAKWIAIDADYDDALENLVELHSSFERDGVASALEMSRRGAHLWILFAEPVLGRECRAYVLHVAHELRIPVKGQGTAEGLELFPRQDALAPTEFGNAIRAPLGVHRATGKRYWYIGANFSLTDQLAFLRAFPRIPEAKLQQLLREKHISSAPVEMQEPSKRVVESPVSFRGQSGFQILEHVGPVRRRGRNYWTRCPSCADCGRDTARDNLAISIAEPWKYKCWAGCTKEMIRASLGVPIPRRGGGLR
jgi:hypothetical protein